MNGLYVAMLYCRPYLLGSSNGDASRNTLITKKEIAMGKIKTITQKRFAVNESTTVLRTCLATKGRQCAKTHGWGRGEGGRNAVTPSQASTKYD